MNKTNKILLSIFAILMLIYFVPMLFAGGSNETATEESEVRSFGSTRFVAAIPRKDLQPDFGAIQKVTIVPPREDARVDRSTPKLDQQELGADLAPVFFDLMPPSTRKELTKADEKVQHNQLPVMDLVHAVERRAWDMLLTARGEIAGDDQILWGEALAYEQVPEFTQNMLMQSGRGLEVRSVSRMAITANDLVGVERYLAQIAAGRTDGNRDPVNFGELSGFANQRVFEFLVPRIADLESMLAPWREPFRRLEKLLGGEARTGFEGWGELAWCDEIAERLAHLRELAGAELLDHPNPQEWAKDRNEVLEVLDTFGKQLDGWRERARAIDAERKSLREAFLALSEKTRNGLCMSYPPRMARRGFRPDPNSLGPNGALSPQIAAQIDAAEAASAKAFLESYLKLSYETVRALRLSIVRASEPLNALEAKMKEMLAASPRNLVLERDAKGEWVIASEGSYPAKPENVDGYWWLDPDCRVACTEEEKTDILETLSPEEKDLRDRGITVEQLRWRRDNEAVAKRREVYGEEDQKPFLLALSSMETDDPRGSWLAREQEYGFTEKAVEFRLEDAEGNEIDRLYLGKPEEESDLQPPWKARRGQEDYKLVYVHSDKRSQAYRVTWNPTVYNLAPGRTLRANTFFKGFQRLFDNLTAEKVAHYTVTRGDQTMKAEKRTSTTGGTDTWHLAQGDAELGQIDAGVAKKVITQLSSLSFDGVAATVAPDGDDWKRFGFGTSDTVIAFDGDEWNATLRIGSFVRRDGELYRAVTYTGGSKSVADDARRGPFAFLVRNLQVKNLTDALDGLAGERKYLEAGPFLKDVDWANVARIQFSEGADGAMIPQYLTLAKKDGAWVCEEASNHPISNGRVTADGTGLLATLQGLRRAYPFEKVEDAQRETIDGKLKAGTKVTLFVEGQEAPVAEFTVAEDPGGVIGGDRVSNFRREGSGKSIVVMQGEEPYLVSDLTIPDLSPDSWIDVQWLAGKAVRSAVALELGGKALPNAAELAATKASDEAPLTWKRGDQDLATADVEAVLTGVDNLRPLGVYNTWNGEGEAPSGTGLDAPWLTLNVTLPGEGEARERVGVVLGKVDGVEGQPASYYGTLSTRPGFVYRFSPLAVESLPASAMKLVPEKQTPPADQDGDTQPAAASDAQKGDGGNAAGTSEPGSAGPSATGEQGEQGEKKEGNSEAGSGEGNQGEEEGSGSSGEGK